MTTQLTEVWTLIPRVGDDADTTVSIWVGRSNRFIAVSSRVEALADGTILTPESQATLRIRWRPDISANSRWIDPYGRLWETSGWEDVGRQQFLDVGIARFGYIASGPTEVFVPPTNWPLQNGTDDSPVQTLQIAHFIEASGSGWVVQDAADPTSQRVGFRVAIPPGRFTVAATGFVLAPIFEGGLATWAVLLPGGQPSVMGVIHLGSQQLLQQAEARIGAIGDSDAFWPAGSRPEPMFSYDMLRLYTTTQANAFDTTIQGLTVGDIIRIQSVS